MSRSAFVEVNITNPTRLAQDSQDTADKAVKGVENLNDPNLMNVIEKQNNIVQFAGLTSQYNVLVQNAKDEGIDTTAVTTAYNNLNIFMADILADPDHASDIDRARYKKYQDAYNEELAKLQNALQNNTNDKFTSAASAISQAVSTANVAKSAADSAYTYANSEIAVQSTATAKAQSAADGAFSEAQKVGEQTSAEISKQSEAIAGAQSKADSAFAKAEEVDGRTSAEIAKQSAATAKAQSTADSAFKEAQSATAYTDKQIASQASAVSEVSKTATEASSKANSALDTANGANAEIVKLKGGSTATIAKLEDGLGTKVSNDTFDSYQTQTASQFAQTVKEADFKTYQTQTSKLIESKVDNGTYQTDKTQTAGAIASKVSSGEFKTYQTQTDKALSSKVSSSDYESDREQTASQIADKVSNGEFSTYKTQTDKLIGSKVDNGDFKTYQTQTDKLINSKVDNGTYQSDKTQTANQIASKVSSTDFNSYKSQTDKAITSKVESSDFKSLQTQVGNSAVGTNLAVGTNQEYAMGYGIPKTTWKDGYAYLKLPANVSNGEILPQDPRTYWYSLTKGTTYTQTIWLETDATVKDLNAVQITWYTGAGHDIQPAMIQKLGQNSYKVVSTYTWPGRGDNNVRLFDIEHLDSAFDFNTGTYLKFGKLKLEKGSLSTDWCLNPTETATNSQITQLSGQIDQKVSSGDFNSYKTQTDKLIGQKVDNGAFKTYQNQTAELIGSKVDNGTYQSDKTQTASQIASKVSSDDFKSYQAQTDKAIESKVDNGTYQSDKTQTAGQIADKVSNGAFNTYKTQTDKLIAEKVSNGDFNTYKSQTAELIRSKVDNGTYQSDKTQTASQIASKVSTGDFNSYKTQTANTLQTLVSKSPSNIIKDGGFNSAVVGKVPSDWTFNNTAQIVANPQYSNDLVALGHPVLQINSKTSGNSDVYYGDWFDVQPGDQFYTELKVRWSSTSQKGTVIIGLETCDAKWGGLQWPGGGGTSSPNNWAEHTGIATVGANAAHARVWVSWQGSSAANEAVLVTDLVVRPAYATHSQFTQLSDDMNLRVKKGDLIDQINIQAGKTLISSSGQLTLSANSVFLDSANPVIMKSANIDKLLVGKKLTAADISANTFTTNNGTFTVNQNGAITAKDMTLSGGKLYSPTINAGTITSAIINGTTFHGGDVINNANNTARYYPMTITPDGAYKSTYFDNVVALRASTESGAISYNYRSMLANGGEYLYSDTVINGQGLTVSSGYTTVKDTTFSAKLTETAYVSISNTGGLFLHGSNANINFGGHLSDDETAMGMYMNPYGNIIGKSSSAYWQISKQGTDNTGGGVTARFGIDTGDKGTINFYRPLFVDEIGGLTSKNGHALFIHGDDSDSNHKTGQMLFRQDGSGPQVVSASIYNRTYSSGSTVTVTGYGTLGRITSASKYKLAIAREPQVEPADRLLTVNPSSWVDLEAAKAIAENKSNGRELLEREQSLTRHHGLIAEDLRDAGLDEFVIYGESGEIEGIQYDRLWTVLIPKIKQLNERINELERKTV